MSHKGSCHCGQVRYEVEGEIESAMECNCSICSRKGYMLWFVPRTALKLLTPPEALSTYTFNKHVIKHQFCRGCGCATFGFAASNGVEMAAINVRCLEDVELTTLKRTQYDGRSL
jgi:hypothetical protein